MKVGPFTFKDWNVYGPSIYRQASNSYAYLGFSLSINEFSYKEWKFDMAHIVYEFEPLQDLYNKMSVKVYTFDELPMAKEKVDNYLLRISKLDAFL